ncbi:hypothetical protein AWB65_06535 [Caballeronia humi]|uniref:Lipoprotein n=1 Tax=Caballeronia humi TaxID=326474 RepID=A0A158JFB0_9BURK|nr:hypothetical protein AWB65_06535 [Caballeronia humi]
MKNWPTTFTMTSASALSLAGCVTGGIHYGATPLSAMRGRDLAALRANARITHTSAT